MTVAAPRAAAVLALLLATLSWGLPMPAAAGVTLPAGADHVRIEGELHALRDAGGELDPAAARAAFAAGGFERWRGLGRPAYGFSGGDVFWFAFELTVEDPRAPLILEIDYPPLARATLHLPASVEPALRRQVAGALVAPEDQPRPSRQPLFVVPPTLEAGQTLLLRVETDGAVAVPLRLWREPAWNDHSIAAHLIFGAYYGLICAMLVYNFAIFLFTRDIAYLYYVLSVATTGMFLLALNGFAGLVLWPGMPEFGLALTAALLHAGLLAATRFARTFLALGHHAPRMDRLLRAAEILLAAAAVLALFAPYAVMIRLGSAATLVLAVAVLAATVLAWSDGARQARFFMLAWIAIIVGGSLHALNAFGLIPVVAVTRHAFQAGSALEVILLSTALADRLRILRQDNERIQREAREGLERNVEERTRELYSVLDRLRESSRRDGLTGIYNREHFDDAFEREWLRAARAGRPLTLMLIDIDHFKAVNDTHGHLFGDKVLRHVAALIRAEAAARTDLVARYGGEEFAVLLPGVAAREAGALAERVRRVVGETRFASGDTSIGLTISIGIETAHPGAGLDGAVVLQRADTALYLAKANGRDRCVHAG